MAKVELLEYTGKGRPDQEWHAADVLIFTKSTRLQMDGAGLEAIKVMPQEQKLQELAYMAGTIPSSWEFVELTFVIHGVSRAAAQQITRTRTASYAMQSQRVTDLSAACVVNPLDPEALPEEHAAYEASVETIMGEYRDAIAAGLEPQDARGLLPMNVECSLVAKYNLRSLVDLLRARSSLRAQGEYADIADQMKAAVLEVWPWAQAFFIHPLDHAIGLLEEVAQELGVTPGTGAGWQIAKAIDLLRKS